MRKYSNIYQPQSQPQSQSQQPQSQSQQPSQPSHPYGIYHKGTWYNPLVYAWQPYADGRHLSYNQPPQSFHGAACPAGYNQVKSSNTNPYSFQPCSDRDSTPEELPQQQQQQQMYYFQPYRYQQAEQVYQVLPVPQYQAMPQQNPELPPQQPTQPISTDLHSTKNNGSNIIEIDLTSSCDVYISSAPAKLVINITSQRGEDHCEAPNYVIRKQAANVKPESKVSFAHDHVESYPEDYSNSAQSLYWAEPQATLVPQQGYVEKLEGQQLERNGYDPCRAPRRVANHHQQTEDADHLVCPLPTVYSLHQNTILKKSNANQKTIDNHEFIPRESLPQADQIPKTLSNSNVLIPDTILPTISRTCDHGSLKNVSEIAGNLTINTESANVLLAETEDKEMANPANLIVSQPEMLEEADKIEEKQDQEAKSSTQPDLIKDITERAEIGDLSNIELVQCSESILSQKSNEIHKPPAIVNESICCKILNISSPDIEHKDIQEKVETENASKLEVVQSLVSDLPNVVPKLNGSHQREKQKPPERKNTMTAAIMPEICHTKPEGIYNKPRNRLSLEVEHVIVPSTTDAHKVVTKSNSKRRKNKKDNLMDSIPIELEPVQPFGSQQACSIKKNPNKLSKLERKALRQIKESQKELKSKEPEKEAEISMIPEEQQQRAMANIPQTDDLESDRDSDDERFALSNISNAQLRRTLRRIIYKINDL